MLVFTDNHIIIGSSCSDKFFIVVSNVAQQDRGEQYASCILEREHFGIPLRATGLLQNLEPSVSLKHP